MFEKTDENYHNNVNLNYVPVRETTDEEFDLMNEEEQKHLLEVLESADEEQK